MWTGEGPRSRLIEVCFQNLLHLISFCEEQEISITEDSFSFESLPLEDFYVWTQTPKTGNFKTDFESFVMKLIEKETKDLMKEFQQRRQEVLKGR